MRALLEGVGDKSIPAIRGEEVKNATGRCLLLGVTPGVLASSSVSSWLLFLFGDLMAMEDATDLALFDLMEAVASLFLAGGAFKRFWKNAFGAGFCSALRSTAISCTSPRSSSKMTFLHVDLAALFCFISLILSCRSDFFPVTGRRFFLQISFRSLHVILSICLSSGTSTSAILSPNNGDSTGCGFLATTRLRPPAFFAGVGVGS
mmetsp:Transcript_11041/g.24297  ORF Transcript_11041/g.24297 Transcript_11041/m.24297 type:complete len:205 (+) Transcript_11041:376-990(+)